MPTAVSRWPAPAAPCRKGKRPAGPVDIYTRRPRRSPQPASSSLARAAASRCGAAPCRKVRPGAGRAAVLQQDAARMSEPRRSHQRHRRCVRAGSAEGRSLPVGARPATADRAARPSLPRFAAIASAQGSHVAPLPPDTATGTSGHARRSRHDIKTQTLARAAACRSARWGRGCTSTTHPTDAGTSASLTLGATPVQERVKATGDRFAAPSRKPGEGGGTP